MAELIPFTRWNISSCSLRMISGNYTPTRNAAVRLIAEYRLNEKEDCCGMSIRSKSRVVGLKSIVLKYNYM